MSDLKRRLKRGFGSSAGIREQVEAYQCICLEAQARIKELEEGISLHKTNVMMQKGKAFHVDSTLWELLEGGE